MSNKEHIWIYAYRDDDTAPLHYRYVHNLYIEEDEIRLPPLEEPWHWVITVESCDCEKYTRKEEHIKEFEEGNG